MKPTQGRLVHGHSSKQDTWLPQTLPTSLTCANQNYRTLGILHEGVHSHPETLVFFKDDINLRDKDKTELYWYPTPLTSLLKHVEFDRKDLFQFCRVNLLWVTQNWLQVRSNEALVLSSMGIYIILYILTLWAEKKLNE